jgi:hypothetical protein
MLNQPTGNMRAAEIYGQGAHKIRTLPLASIPLKIPPKQDVIEVIVQTFVT